MRQKDRKEIRKEVGMVFQGGALFDSLTVEQNVRFPLDMFTLMGAREKAARVDFCLDHVNLTGAHRLFLRNQRRHAKKGSHRQGHCPESPLSLL